MEKKTVFARFYNKQIRTGEFDEHGLPVFATRVYIKIRVVDSFDEVDRMADRQDMQRFAQEYEEFLKRAEKEKKGTPLNMFAFLSPAQIECCNIKDIYTVEELSKLTKEKAADLGLIDEVEAAKKFISFSKDNKAIAAANKRIAELETQLEALKAENAELRNIKDNRE
jgi:cell division protein FtsB